MTLNGSPIDLGVAIVLAAIAFVCAGASLRAFYRDWIKPPPPPPATDLQIALDNVKAALIEVGVAMGAALAPVIDAFLKETRHADDE
jgi:hypothetical protein